MSWCGCKRTWFHRGHRVIMKLRADLIGTMPIWRGASWTIAQFETTTKKKRTHGDRAVRLMAIVCSMALRLIISANPAILQMIFKKKRWRKPWTYVCSVERRRFYSRRAAKRLVQQRLNTHTHSRHGGPTNWLNISDTLTAQWMIQKRRWKTHKRLIERSCTRVA